MIRQAVYAFSVQLHKLLMRRAKNLKWHVIEEAVAVLRIGEKLNGMQGCFDFPYLIRRALLGGKDRGADILRIGNINVKTEIG